MNLNRMNHFGATRNVTALALSAVLLIPTGYAPTLQAQDANYQNANYQDPPSRVARIAVANGNVSLEPAGVDEFSQAELNYPLTAGDRIYADNAATAELQTSGLAVRLGNGADLTLSSLTDDVAQFGLAQGSIRLRTRDLSTPDGQQATVEIDTPNGTILVQRAGDIRVDSYPQDDTTVVTVSSGQVEVSGTGINQYVGPNQSLRLAGNPVFAEPVRMLPPDNLDRFDLDREQERQRSYQVSSAYVDPGMIGVSDLGQYGDWNPDPEYGAVWFPRAVPANWVPYSNGHWAWVAPWGWTWIEAEPWGFAPFHYGRWANFGGRWGWVAGPPPASFRDAGFGGHAPRPVYSPALVAFVGGPRFSISLGFGGGSGAGVTAWFPLGPHEAYQPWYHASPAYVNRVNVTNIYNRNATEVRNNYNNRTVNVYNTQVNNVTYVNRPQATVAIPQRDFAAGRGVGQSQRIRMDENTQRQLAQAPILPHPLVTPDRGAAAPQGGPRAVPPNQGRPVVETRNGFERTGSNTPAQNPQQPGGQPGQAPFRGGPVRNPGQKGAPVAQNPQPTVAPHPVNPPQAPPQAAPRPNPTQQPAGSWTRGGFPQQRDHAPLAPQAPQAPMAQAPPVAAQPQQPGRPTAVQPQPVRPPVAVTTPATVPPTNTPQNGQGQGQNRGQYQGQNGGQNGFQRQAPRAPDQERPLVNRTVPQQPQPAFVQQQQAIQKTDPGRPLGPQQVQNLRNGQPAGPHTQPEPVQHPNVTAEPERPRLLHPNDPK